MKVFDAIILKILLLLVIFDPGCSLSCYECTADLSIEDIDPCLYGDRRFLMMTHCREPSVCAAYRFRTETPYGPRLSITRGCQAIRYGATCEDIFDDLRRTGSVLPGQHTCATCSEDLCNSSPNVKRTFLHMLLPLMTIILLIVQWWN